MPGVYVLQRPLFLRIVSPYFVAGVEVGGRYAPIVQYMARWDEGRIRAYCRKKRWQCDEC